MKMHTDIFGEKDDISRIVNRVYDIGYDKGYKDRQIEEEFDESIEEAYQKGLDDAWECAKKIALHCNDGGYSHKELRDIFTESSWEDVIKHMSASEAIAKIEEYEEKKKADDEIKVGDEIIDSSGNRGVVVALLEYEDFRVLWLDGTVSTTSDTYKKKTGRHFDIPNILDQMKK